MSGHIVRLAFHLQKTGSHLEGLDNVSSWGSYVKTGQARANTDHYSRLSLKEKNAHVFVRNGAFHTER